MLSAEGRILLDLMSRPQESPTRSQTFEVNIRLFAKQFRFTILSSIEWVCLNMCYTKIPWFKQPFHDMFFISQKLAILELILMFSLYLFPHVSFSFHKIPCWGSQHGPPWNSSSWLQRTPTPPASAETPVPRGNSWPETETGDSFLANPQGILAKYLSISGLVHVGYKLLYDEIFKASIPIDGIISSSLADLVKLSGLKIAHI